MPPKRGAKSATLANGHKGAITLPGRSLMKERAYAEIKRSILGGTFQPGSFVAERQLADHLGMSKTPVRAALERLEAEGFITIPPQQGIVIRDLTVQEVADHYEIRVALETYVVRTLAGRLTPAQAERLEANLRALAAARDAHDVTRAVALDAEFHTL